MHLMIHNVIINQSKKKYEKKIFNFLEKYKWKRNNIK